MKLDLIHSYLFLKDKKRYLQLPPHTILNTFFTTKMDSFVWMYARLKGMSVISKRKYGTYNKAIDGEKLFKMYPWINYYK